MTHTNQHGAKHYLANQPQAGQVTIALAGVVALALLLAVALAVVGEAMIHRARARTAADMVALAATVSTDDAAELGAGYRNQGIDVQIEQLADRSSAYAASGPSQARAWAGRTAPAVATSPALRAIVARVEQLRGVSLSTVSWDGSAFVLRGDQADVMRSMQTEFLLCSTPTPGGDWRFESC